MSKITLTVKTPYWQLEEHYLQHVLHNQSVSTLGWQRLVLIAKNEAAERFLQQHGSVMLRQNDHLQGVPLNHDDLRKAALVFYRHNPLHKLTLDFVMPAGFDVAEPLHFSVRVKPISAAKAWFFMLQAVSKKDKKKGLGAAHIYRMTRARQKRSGGEHALRKLVQAYQPLLQYQLISCEPYNYWRLHLEPASRQALLKHLKPATALTVHGLNAETPVATINADHWYYWRSEDYLYTRQFEQLLQAAVTQAEQQQTDILYWDHDYLSADGERIQPHFKPDWSPELLMAQDYIGCSYAVKGELLLKAGSHWQQLSDSYCRLLNLLQFSQRPPLHVPVLLQHRHYQAPHPDTSVTIEQARQQALQQWLTQQHQAPLSIESGVDIGVRKVNFALPKGSHQQPCVSIVVPTRDGLAITRNCVESVLNHTDYRDFELIIVDNQSTCPDTLAWFKQIAQHPQVRVLTYDAPFNYSAINNTAAAHAQGDYLCFLNNDTEVITPAWLGEIVQHAHRPGIGCVGAKLYYPDNTVQHAGVIMGLWGLAGHGHKNFTRYSPGYCLRLNCLQNYSAVTAACLVIKKSRFERVGGFNETELTVAFNDVDLCLKVQAAGYRNVWTPYAELYHYESKSRGKEDSPEKRAREQREIDYMQTTWQQAIVHDPAYSPHLTRLQEDFGINLNGSGESKH